MRDFFVLIIGSPPGPVNLYRQLLSTVAVNPSGKPILEAMTRLALLFSSFSIFLFFLIRDFVISFKLILKGLLIFGDTFSLVSLEIGDCINGRTFTISGDNSKSVVVEITLDVSSSLFVLVLLLEAYITLGIIGSNSESVADANVNDDA